MQYVIFAVFVGSALFANMVGELTTIATSYSAGEMAYKSKLASVQEFLKYYEVPAAMRRGIRNYFKTTWKRSIYFDRRGILAELPFSLRKVGNDQPSVTTRLLACLICDFPPFWLFVTAIYSCTGPWHVFNEVGRAESAVLAGS
jgi:hypothetical protein